MIAVSSDHAGFSLLQEIIRHLEESGIEYKNYGCKDRTSCDYPDCAVPACRAVVSGEAEKAVLVCGTGIGMSLTANKIKGIRAAVCGDYFSAKHTRLHNDANVLCLGERVVGPGLALELVDVFLKTEFEGGKHKRRIDKIAELEK